MEMIECPKCGEEFELTEALRTKLEAETADDFKKQKKSLEKQFEKERKEFTAKYTTLLETERAKIIKRITAERDDETETLEKELQEKREQLLVANQLELTLRKDKQVLKDAEANFELTVQRKLDEERQTITEQATKAAMKQEQLTQTKMAKKLLVKIRKKNWKIGCVKLFHSTNLKRLKKDKKVLTYSREYTTKVRRSVVRFCGKLKTQKSLVFLG